MDLEIKGIRERLEKGKDATNSSKRALEME